MNIDDMVTITSGPRKGQIGKVITLPLGNKSETYTILVQGKGVLVDGSEIEKSPDSGDEAGQLVLTVSSTPFEIKEVYQ